MNTTATPNTADSPRDTPIESPKASTTISTEQPAPVAPIAPSVVKFSLSSLKQGGPSVEVVPAARVEESVVETTSEAAWQPASVDQNIVTVSNIIKEDTIEETLDLTEDEPKEVVGGLEDVAKEVIAEKQESLSITEEKSEPTVEAVAEDKKEFFPNLDVLGEFDFLDDEVLGNRPDIIAKKTTEPVSEKLETPVTTSESLVIGEPVAPIEIEPEAVAEEPVVAEEIMMPVVAEETLAEEIQPVVSEMVEVVDAVAEPIALDEVPVTAEYVEEVKQELSQERQVGGLKKFMKVFAVASIGGILMIGTLFGVGAYLKHAKTPLKSSTLETTTPVVQDPVTPPFTPEAPIPTVSTPNVPTPETPAALTDSGSTTETGSTSTGTTSTGALTDSGSTSETGSTFTGTTSTGDTLTSEPVPTYIEGVDYQTIPNMKKNISRKK